MDNMAHPIDFAAATQRAANPGFRLGKVVPV
jgi:hypothetical protein